MSYALLVELRRALLIVIAALDKEIAAQKSTSK